MDSFTGYNHSHNLSVQYNLSVPSVDVTCDDLDEFSCADGRECILKGIQQILNSKYQISHYNIEVAQKQVGLYVNEYSCHNYRLQM